MLDRVRGGDWRPGPEVPKAHSYQIAFCGSPDCGLHLLSRREDDTVICETVMSPEGTVALVEICIEHLITSGAYKRPDDDA